MTSLQPPSTPVVPASLPLLDTEVLRTFVAIAESGSFTRAAAQVFRTPSALSMQIKRLEETLGKTLFLREARQVRLTPDGEVLLSYGRRLLKLNEEAVTQFLLPSLCGTVRLGTSDDIGTRILPGVLAQFARSHPATQVDVVIGRSIDMTERLDAGELDLIVITAGNTGQEEGRGKIVHTEALVWAGREGGIAAMKTPLPVSLANAGCTWRNMALKSLDQAAVDYRIAYTSESCSGQAAAMIADLAVAPFPACMVKPPLRKLGKEYGLPPLGDYQILLVQRQGAEDTCNTLAGHVIDALQGLR
ncbi:LysR family transcriptional regulator [Nitrincola iocasae]|uniref:LysR family transcriptional regulator n=1 Tax=Nitrincola iocasae TaxID=2614693 RepID=A0A5J6LG59_9GAMM|nr:LysR family transcriptional regulator [Nitrincola iocasae]QEW07547.1 LysR family transcriptional regulator [Nitrincola iocasae]